jgi:hypothetical protein
MIGEDRAEQGRAEYSRVRLGMQALTFWGSGVTCIEFATASKKFSSNSSEGK